MAHYPLCPATEISVGQMKRFKVNGVKVLVYHLTDGFYATQNSCTHTFGPLQRGKIIDGCKIQCPIHRACFDVRTGEVVQWANFPPRDIVVEYPSERKGTQDVSCYGRQRANIHGCVVVVFHEKSCLKI